MPEGAKIFETTGHWEDFSTPSRDLRLLIAIDVARGLPARVARRPERYAMPAGKTPEASARRARRRDSRASSKTRTFEYKRSDGSPTGRSTLEDVVASRPTALEMAYNPNDCVEPRWGAPDGERRGVDVQGARAGAPAREDAELSELVSRAAKAAEVSLRS